MIARRAGLQRASVTVASFCVIWLAIGCYKFVENYAHFGRAIVHNLDADHSQVNYYTGAWKGWQSVYDINVIKLIRRPIMQVRNTLSYPLLMYATFWYPHFPDSSFRGNVFGYQWIGSAIYAVAIVPTIAFLFGVFRSIRTAARWIRSREIDPGSAIVALSAALVVSNLAIVIAAGVRFDVWACFQSRLCFQSLAPAIVLFGIGAEWFLQNRWTRIILYAATGATIACAVLYFTVEIGLTYGWLARGTEVLP